MMDWHHPRIANPDCAIHESDNIAAEARAAWSRRRAAYPDLVKTGRITADDARADLEAWRAIAKDWHWIAFGEGDPADPETLPNRIAALDTAIARWLEMVAENGGHASLADDRQGKLLCAMRWWAERERPGFSGPRHIRDTAAIGHAWRRQNGLPTRGAMLAAQEPAQQSERKAAA
ncbi:hypothetical protein MB02_01300 [Croceicoccus estronivorus]|uniref:hypothetical protein n=1 Tax=Croceicoccus estronivorus TaxID=1172626 RepID=UPI00082B920F|nr:hypothetical protein [Croceicoccus estronivorus]OCC25335.1 hypothetical protein MB02_01300 [Croceicoccus estronivorus]